jgi:thymidylate kinase
MASAELNGAGRLITGGRPYVVSFSGIDGAGKTTQIDALVAWLRDAGLQVRLLRFWDDITVAGGLREGMSHNLFKSEKGVGSPLKPVQRRDKNVRGWYMTVARLFLYLLDAARLTFVVAAGSRKDADVVVFDRYIYDELANLDLANRAVKAYVRFLLMLVPRPDVAFLLDAEPDQARARKPEYPLEFLHRSRASYLVLSQSANMTVIEPLTPADVTRLVLEAVASASVVGETDARQPLAYR